MSEITNGAQRQRHRITTAEWEKDGRQYTLTFKEDGMHVHEKHQPTKKDKIITLAEMIGAPVPETKSPPLKAGAKACPDYKEGSISETFDVAANDLCLLAVWRHSKTPIEKAALEEAKDKILRALKIIRSLETISD